MEFNNNEEDDNRGRNPLINSNNNNNENNNINDNNNVNENNNINDNNDNNNNINNPDINNNEYLSRYNSFSLSFIIILLFNLIILIISFYYEFEIYKFVFDKDSIIDHSQYYRFITRYFVHFGIGHFLIELYITYYLCNYFENMFGTLMTIPFIFISMIINSIIQLGLCYIISFICFKFNLIDDSIIHYEGGLTPVLFSLNTFFYLFEHDLLTEYNMFLFVFGNGKYSSFTILIVLYFFTPNKTFIGNLSGIIGAYCIKKFFLCFLPKISWIIEFEDILNLNKEGNFYRYITSENPIMKNVLNQIEPNSVRDIDVEIEKKEEINLNNNQIIDINNNNNNHDNHSHQSAIEMSSIINNNN